MFRKSWRKSLIVAWRASIAAVSVTHIVYLLCEIHHELLQQWRDEESHTSEG